MHIATYEAVKPLKETLRSELKIAPLLFVLFQLACMSAKGSELPDSSFIWTIRTIEWGRCEGTSTYMVSGDTLIGTKVYKQILITPDSIYSDSNSSYYCAARDSAGFWFFIPGGDSTEYQLYNFNASIGEIIKINNPWSVGEVDVHIISKDSVLIGDEYKTRLGIGIRQGELWEYWIEDIGCLSGVFYSCFFIFDIGYSLSCTYKNGEFYYNFGFAEFCGCWPKTSIDKLLKDPHVSIYPSPSNGTLHIKNQLHESSIVSFYSIEGKLIDEYILEGETSKRISLNHVGSVIARIEVNGTVTSQIIQIIR